MALEIERKFLLINDNWKQQVQSHSFYRQAYLSGTEKSSIRVRIANDSAYLNIKSATLGIRRTEYDYNIPLVDANEMIEHLCQGACIEKTRYFVPFKQHLWEIDVFAGPNNGLIVAEIELGHEDEYFAKPDWLGKEVSADPRYYNVCLVDHPYCQWDKA